MSTTAGRQHPLGTIPSSTRTGVPAGEESLARPVSDRRDTARAIAVRAGQLLVWALVTAPIALVLTCLCLALIGAAFALLTG